MKFNPYAALLMTGALMTVTVVAAQVDANAALLKAGVVSVDRDVSSFAVRTVTAFQGRSTLNDATPNPRIQVASVDQQSNGNASPD